MYNDERKQEYITENINRNMSLGANATIFFRRVEEYETTLNKDCCDFTFDEIIDFYKSHMSYSLSALQNMHSQYKLYTSWCVAKGYVMDGINHYKEVDAQAITKCINQGLKSKRITTRKEITSKYGSLIVNAKDIFLCIAIFEGIGACGLGEFYQLSMNDFEGNVVHLNSGRDLEVSSQLVSYAQEASMEFECYPYSYPNASRMIKYDPSDDAIIKRKYNVRYDDVKLFERRLKNSLKLLKEKTQIGALDQICLRESGRIDMIKKLMEKSKSKDWWQTYIDNKDDIDYRYGTSSGWQRKIVATREYAEYFS